jgi:hypothetical protein
MEEKQSNPVYKNQEYGKYRELFYSYGPEGQFEKSVGYHGEADRLTLQQTWDFFDERIQDARQKVKDGKASPILFWMEKIYVTPSELSTHTGIMTWRIKRHLKPKVFNGLSEKTLSKYAEAFNITPHELKNIE